MEWKPIKLLNSIKYDWFLGYQTLIAFDLLPLDAWWKLEPLRLITEKKKHWIGQILLLSKRSILLLFNKNAFQIINKTTSV